MKLGIIGVGAVGDTLKQWLERHTIHQIACLDPIKKYKDDLSNSDAIFICIPIEPFGDGQDLEILKQEIKRANACSKNVFIRSTVLPGTNDSLSTIAMPEFLTQRFAEHDMERLPILCGKTDINLIKKIFPGKKIIMVSNAEAEIAKYAHNCFGAMKVTYFNIINKICKIYDADYEKILNAIGVTGFIEPYHTQVPGPDGQYGYGGKCFPPNIESFYKMLYWNDECSLEALFFESIINLNKKYRNKKPQLTYGENKDQTKECQY